MNGTAGGLRNYLRSILSPPSDPVMTRYRVRLPSALAEAQFQATIALMWPQGITIDERQQAIAERQLLDVARSTALQYSVLDLDEARAAVILALRDHDLRDLDTQPVVASANIEVGLDDMRMAEERQALRRQTALAREARLEEVEQLRVLADQVLATPTVARLWWLEGKPGKLEDLVAKGKDGMFEKVAELFGTPVEFQAADPIAELIRLFLQGLDTRLREQLISQLRWVFDSYERPDLAGRLDVYQHPRAGSRNDASPADFDRHAPASGLR
jgi:hypothetical protein